MADAKSGSSDMIEKRRGPWGALKWATSLGKRLKDTCNITPQGYAMDARSTRWEDMRSKDDRLWIIKEVGGLSEFQNLEKNDGFQKAKQRSCGKLKMPIMRVVFGLFCRPRPEIYFAGKI